MNEKEDNRPEIVKLLEELAEQQEKEERATWVKSSENSSEQQEETKENVQEEKGAEELPNLPKETDKKPLTIKDFSNMDEWLEAYYKGELVEFPEWIRENGKKIEVLPQKLFKYIKKNYSILAVKLGNSKGIVLYRYKNGRYELLTDSEFKAFIKDFIPVDIREPQHYERIFKEFQTEHTNIEESELNSNESIINLRNGVFNLETGKLLPHSSKYYSTIQIPCNYLPNARLSQAKVTMKFLNDITSGNSDDIMTLLEYIGVAISNVYGYRYKKFLVLKGAGNTGKSVLLSFVNYLLGEDNVYTSDIKKLHTNFGLAGAYGKRLISCGDMKFASIAEIDIIKELTGGDYVNLEAKYQNSFTTKYTGVMWFNCNDLPAFSGDKGIHVYERFIIVSCDNVIPPEQRDPELLDKLKAESDIVITVAIKFAMKTIEDGYKFTESEKTISNRKKYELENDSLSLFIESCCVVGEGRTTTREFKQQYQQWCKENNLRAEKPNSIRKVLKEKYGIDCYKSNTPYYPITVKQF